MKKRVLGIALAVLICCSVLAPTAAAAAEKTLIANPEMQANYDLFTTAAVKLSDCLSTTEQTLRSYAYDNSISEETVTIYHVAKNSTCIIAPTAENTESLFLGLSEYKLKDGFLDSTGCFGGIQPLGDGYFNTMRSPGQQPSPTAEKPAKFVFGINSKDRVLTSGTGDPYDVVLKPGYLYRVSVGGVANWFGDTFWFTIAEDETVSPNINKLTAISTSSEMLLNGKEVSIDAYNINSNNYCKIRDVAMLLNGTGKQFEVTWDKTLQAVSMTSNHAYTPVGGELAKGDGSARTATLNTAKIYLDGKEVSLAAYTIGENNYIKLRDLGQTFDFGVSFDSATGAVRIDTTKGYTA